MNACFDPSAEAASVANLRARDRLLSLPYEPLFIADWDRALMIHYEVDPAQLRRIIPFELDLIDGCAHVSLVAFTLRRMRPRFGGAVLEWLSKPIATHHFLNVRTYVRCHGESGIVFMTEWLSNRLSVHLGPIAFGLPYRYGAISYNHDHERGRLSGKVVDRSDANLAFEYSATVDPAAVFSQCVSGSLSEMLMERYTAFTHARGKSRFFRVWHLPWKQQPVCVDVIDQSLLEANWDFFRRAEPVAANYSWGVENVLMGWPHDVDRISYCS